MVVKNIQVLLAKRPEGWVQEDNFRIVEAETPRPSEGQVLVRNIFLSLDPYMRGRMNEAKSYAAPAALNEVMVGETAGEVVESKSPKFKAGDTVCGYLGWQRFAAADARGLRAVDPKIVPLSAYLGVAGMPGVTAWYGLLEISRPNPGETVAVSGRVAQPFVFESFLDRATRSEDTTSRIHPGVMKRGCPILPDLVGKGGAFGPAPAQEFETLLRSQTPAFHHLQLLPAATAAFTISGPNLADFAQSNNCPVPPATLAAGASCTITLTFTPSPPGTAESATLTVIDNAAPGTQIVALLGNAGSFTLAVQTGFGTTAMVTPGQTAQYNLMAVPVGGFIGTVNLTCTGNPATTICSASPTSVTLNGTLSLNVTVTVQTNCVSIAPRWPRGLPPGMGRPIAALWLATLLALLMLRWLAPTARAARWAPTMALLLLMATWVVCAAGFNPDPPGQPSGPTTPAGTYNIQVIGTSGTGATALTSTLPIVLKVL